MTWARGSTRAWRLLRAEILERDPYCRLRFDGCTGVSTQADHVVNLEAGGTDDPANLQGVCRACHDRKTSTEAARGRSRGKQVEAHPGIRISPRA